MEYFSKVLGSLFQIPYILKCWKSYTMVMKSAYCVRDSIFWPGKSKKVRNIVEACTTFQTFQDSKKKQPIVQGEVPPFPWHTIMSDLFYWNKMDHVITGCMYSKFLILRNLPKITSSQIVRIFWSVICEWGLPVVIKTDNGTQYTKVEFQEICQKYGIFLKTYSPQHPQ